MSDGGYTATYCRVQFYFPDNGTWSGIQLTNAAIYCAYTIGVDQDNGDLYVMTYENILKWMGGQSWLLITDKVANEFLHYSLGGGLLVNNGAMYLLNISLQKYI